jgi:hypothetical protein
MDNECKKIICFGKNSFVANGFDSHILKHNRKVDWFSRGKESKVRNVIYGKIDEILNNSYFDDEYETLINFVILKDCSIEQNLVFIDNLLKLGTKLQIKKFIHFSTVMTYSYQADNIDEYSEIEDLHKTWKGNYAKIKIAVDKFIMENEEKYDFQISIVRPGYVYDSFQSPNFSVSSLGKFRFLIGDKKSILPTVEKNELHFALISLANLDELPKVAHFFKEGGTNKFFYTKNIYPKSVLIFLNGFIFFMIPKYIFSFSEKSRILYSRLESMFIRTYFSSKKTCSLLKIKFS